MTIISKYSIAAVLVPILALLWPGRSAQQRDSIQKIKDEPRLIHADVPMYPQNARISHIVGSVEVRVTVKGGQVDNTTVISGHPLLAKATVENISTWNFEPDADSSEIDQHSSTKPISVPVIPIRGSERSDAGDVDCGGSDRNRQGTFPPQRSGGWV